MKNNITKKLQDCVTAIIVVATRVTGSDAVRIRHLIYGTHLHGVIALGRGMEDSEVATLVSEARNTVLETMGNRA